MNIRDYLSQHRLVTDGAMGTYYAQLSGKESPVSEWANVREPELIARIHREYLEAGASLLRTNTFAAGCSVLGITQAEQEELVRAACRIAKAEIDKFCAGTERQCFLAGDIGPIKNICRDGGETDTAAEYRRLIDLFIAEGVDAILFETFPEPGEIGEAAAYAKSKKPDIFCIAEFSVNKNGYSAGGFRAERLLHTALGMEAIDAVGFNCGIGSAHMLALVESLKLPRGRYVCISPNAGYPEQLQNRMVFMQNTQYFLENMKKIADKGVAVLGACCGSTPEYIRGLAEYVDKLPPVSIEGEPEAAAQTGQGAQTERTEQETGKKNAENNPLLRLMTRKQVIAVELDPPYDADDSKLIAAALRLKELGADVITIADSPQGRSRMDSVLTAVKLQRLTGLPVMPHICCRDKNMIAMRALLLGAYANDIRNLLLVTGDPVPGELRSSTTGVFDYNSMKLMQFVQQMNLEHFEEEPIVFGGAVNQGRAAFDKELARVKRKIEAGASYFLTQPVYCERDEQNLRRMKRETGTRVLAGIMPLVSYRNASFVKNELVGIEVPDEVLAFYRPDMSREEGEEAGVRIALQQMEKMRDFADGFYFMLPFNRVSLMEKIMKEWRNR